MKNLKLRSAMKLIQNNLLRLILFAIAATLITWNNPLYLSAGNAQTSTIAATPPESTSSDALPTEVKTAVVNDAVKRTSKTVSAIKITEARSQQWSDGCLGLAKADEICTQAITPGYQVKVTDGINNWIYRTDATGNAVRLETDGEE